MFFKKRKLPKLNEFSDIYGVQIFTMMCITYIQVNIERERKASANKNVLVSIYQNKDVHINTGKLPFSSCLKLMLQYRILKQICSDAHSITLNTYVKAMSHLVNFLHQPLTTRRKSILILIVLVLYCIVFCFCQLSNSAREDIF